MATFEYNALTSAGRLMKGTIEAGTQQEASQTLEQMQLSVNSIDAARPQKLKTAIGRNEFLLFNQQLAAITKAGIPLERGLRELAADVSSKSMRRLIDDIAGELEAGVSIDEAFEKRQKRFPPLYGRILKAGVETGRLSEMLASLNRHLDLANQTRRIIFEAMGYPAIVLALVCIVMTGIFMFIIPQFGEILGEMTGTADLPGLTRLFLNMAENVIPFWITVGCFIAAIVFFLSMSSSSSTGRRLKETVFMKIPVIGRVYHSSVLSRMAEAMAMMISAGADMPTCLRLAAGSTGSEKLMLEGDALAGQIEQGANILEAGQFCRMIPRLFIYSIQLGTQRNELQDNLYSLGQMYAEQAKCGQARLQAILLPTMIIALGGVVATCVISMFLPMIKIVTVMST
ncbi:MAG: type II secretion system F family protein [Sedimentisphaerales bacterium]|nr:type II secretion system F family protein [Sedimentisphaerales bacterium]